MTLLAKNGKMSAGDIIKQTGLSGKVIESIVSEAEKHGIRKLCLFGSRARGDYEEKSDIDLAAYDGDIGLFKLDIEERAPTLLMFDVVDMGKTKSPDLIEAVEKEGILLYEKV